MSMIAQCDVDGKKQLSINAFMDHAPDKNAIGDDNQFIVMNGRHTTTKQPPDSP